MSGTFTCQDANYAGSNYSVNKPIRNASQSISLYLGNISVPTSYELAIQNISTQQYIAGVIEVLQYIP